MTATRGLLDKLDKSELEGVIAHEMSHVGNYDIRVMTLTVVLVGLVALLADFFLRFTFWGAGSRSNNRDRGGSAYVVLFAVAILFAILAPIAAQLIQLAISRQREYLADASGALLCRNPDALARALEKISGGPGAAGGGEQGDRAPLVQQPAQRPWVVAQQPLQHAPADRRSASGCCGRCRAHPACAALPSGERNMGQSCERSGRRRASHRPARCGLLFWLFQRC